MSYRASVEAIDAAWRSVQWWRTSADGWMEQAATWRVLKDEDGARYCEEMAARSEAMVRRAVGAWIDAAEHWANLRYACVVAARRAT